MAAVRRSIDLHWQAGVDERYLEVAQTALTQSFADLGLRTRFEVRRLGNLPGMRGILRKAKAVSKKAKKPSTQVDSQTVADWVYAQVPQGLRFVVLKDDLGCPEEDYVFGMAGDEWGGVVSTYRYERDNRVDDPLRSFRAAVIHELGHVLGAADKGRGISMTEWLGPHCTNACVMRQFDDLPENERHLIEDMRFLTFCGLCRRDIAKHLDA